MEDKKKQIPKHTTIIHKVRLSLGMTCNEYCVADIIYALSNNPNSKVSGWCFASRKTIGTFIGVNEKSTIHLISKLVEKGLVEKDEETKYLKTTSLWYNNVVLERIKMKNITTVESTATQKKVQPPTVDTTADDTVDTTDNKNNRYKDSYNSNDIYIPKNFFSSNEINDDVKKFLTIKGYDTTIKEELSAFRDYWNETNNAGKERWRGEKYFDIKRRLGTWFKNSETFNKNKGEIKECHL